MITLFFVFHLFAQSSDTPKDDYQPLEPEPRSLQMIFV